MVSTGQPMMIDVAHSAAMKITKKRSAENMLPKSGASYKNHLRGIQNWMPYDMACGIRNLLKIYVRLLNTESLQDVVGSDHQPHIRVDQATLARTHWQAEGP